MAAVMMREGRFDKRLAHAAIEEAKQANFAELPALQPMPEIDTSANAITPDRTVDVLLTLAAPRIVLLGNVLSAEECDSLCAHVNQRLTRSPVVANGDDAATIDAGRTSRGAMLARAETELIARIEKRLAALANWPVEHGEGLQVQRYGTGNEYRPHYDWFDPSMPWSAQASGARRAEGRHVHAKSVIFQLYFPKFSIFTSERCNTGHGRIQPPVTRTTPLSRHQGAGATGMIRVDQAVYLKGRQIQSRCRLDRLEIAIDHRLNSLGVIHFTHGYRNSPVLPMSAS